MRGSQGSLLFFALGCDRVGRLLLGYHTLDQCQKIARGIVRQGQDELCECEMIGGFLRGLAQKVRRCLILTASLSISEHVAELAGIA